MKINKHTLVYIHVTNLNELLNIRSYILSLSRCLYLVEQVIPGMSFCHLICIYFGVRFATHSNPWIHSTYTRQRYPPHGTETWNKTWIYYCKAHIRFIACERRWIIYNQTKKSFVSSTILYASEFESKATILLYIYIYIVPKDELECFLRISRMSSFHIEYIRSQTARAARLSSLWHTQCSDI